MAKITPFYFSEWTGIKPEIPFCLDIHEINGIYKNHRHVFIELNYIIDGTGTEIINGKSHPLRPGTLNLILPYQTHEIHTNKNEVIKLFNCTMMLEVFFGPNKIGTDINIILFKNEEELSPFVNFEGENAQRVLGIFKDMKHEFDNNQIWYDLMFKSKIAELLVLFDRQRRLISNTLNRDIIKNDNNIWDIIYYIHKHYSEDISLGSLAKYFYINSSYLSTQFKKFIGISFKAFLNEIRILYACSLLSSNIPVTQIAFDTGFKSYSSFCRAFMQNKKMSAVEYRKLIRSQASEF